MRALNFSAGPAMLPVPVLEEAARELVDYKGAGLSVMEMSHRSAEYDEIHQSTLAGIRTLLGVSDAYDVLLLQGGASLQFSQVPMNLMHPAGKADYVLTGVWSKKAVAEAKKVGEVHVAGSTEADGFTRIPRSDELELDPDADYVHITTNNTIHGTQWRREPETGGVPLVADMSSDILSRPIDAGRYDLIYAGAQKNMGPAGVTTVIVRRDLYGHIPDDLPSMLDYRVQAKKESLYNTPPCWAIYVLGLVCKWVASQGGLSTMERVNEAKAKLLYDVLDSSDFYRGTVETASRSLMNIPFRLPTEDLEKRFIAESVEAGMRNLKGHRSVGGVRASIYNAMPISAVETLVDFMKEFERRSG